MLQTRTGKRTGAGGAEDRRRYGRMTALIDRRRSGQAHRAGLARSAPASDARSRSAEKRHRRAACPLRRAPPPARSCSPPTRPRARAAEGRDSHSGPHRNQPRGHPRHARGQGHPDHARRHDQPRGGGRARHGPRLRRRAPASCGSTTRAQHDRGQGHHRARRRHHHHRRLDRRGHAGRGADRPARAVRRFRRP